jgi:hypothetical protein
LTVAHCLGYKNYQDSGIILPPTIGSTLILSSETIVALAFRLDAMPTLLHTNMQKYYVMSYVRVIKKLI